MISVIFFLSFFALFPVFSYEAKSLEMPFRQTSTVSIVPVPPTVEPNNASLRLAFPQEEEQTDIPLVLNVRLRGYSLGTSSYFDRGEEILDRKEGQSLHIIVDNEPYIAYAGGGIDPFDRDGNYYDNNYQIKLPGSFSQGEHLLRLFLARSYGESLKSSECFAMVRFYVGRTRRPKEIAYPILTYNEPSPKRLYNDQDPILLDFFVTDGVLAKGSYAVKVRVDGKYLRTLYEQTPHYIYGLSKGKHTIALTLVDQNGKELQGKYQRFRTVIKVQSI